MRELYIRNTIHVQILQNRMSSFKFSTRFSVIVLFVVASCTDQKFSSQPTPSPRSTAPIEENTLATTQSPFNKTVGSPINRETALRWMENLTNTDSKVANTEYFIQAGPIKSLLSNTECVGISLFYAIDDSEKLHIIPMGINSSGKVIDSRTVTIQSGPLTWQTTWTQTAWKWINNYKGTIKAHYFGATTFNRLILEQKSTTIRVSFAANDSGAPQLLLSNASITNPVFYEDASITCPPYCPSLD